MKVYPCATEPGRPDLALPVAVRGPKGSHYLLLAATIDVGTNSNHIRPFLVRLHGRVAGGLFAIDDSHASIILQTINECQREGLLPGYQAKREVPGILADANRFVAGEARGNLDAWARRFNSPHQVVQTLAQRIYYQGREPSEGRKKLWMFMRWMVRPAPDLRRWDHLSPRELLVPVDRHVARVAQALGLISARQATNPTRTEVEAITAFARALFPDDPTCVDYAFFLWGRGSTTKAVSPDSCCGEFAERGAACPLRHSLPCSLLCQ